MFFLSLLVMSAYQVVWTPTTIEIPLYESVENYLYEPTAILYLDNQMIDTKSYYEYGVNHTFISVVNSRHVRTYYIDYKVYFPDYKYTHTQTIEIKIMDEIPPKITSIPIFSSSVFDKMVDVKVGLVYKDNYDEADQLILTADVSRVDVKKVGTYEIIYTIKDLSGNKTTQSGRYEVYDRIAPTIQQKKDLIVEIGEDFMWNQFFTIQDNSKQTIMVSVDDEQVRYQVLGTYFVTICAQDMSLNEACDIFYIQIVDTIKPILILSTNPDPIDVYQDVNDIDYYQYITVLKDNETPKEAIEILIEHDVDTNRIGTYKIYYTAIDRSLNQTKAELKIQVVDRIKPEIILKEAIIVDVFSLNIDMNSFLVITDNYNDWEELTITYTHKANLKVTGSYDLVIKVTDKSKNIAILETKIQVLDRISPIISEIKEFIIELYQDYNIKDYFAFEDQYDSPNDISIQVHGVKEIHAVGSYDIVVEAADRSGNIKAFNTILYVVDLTAPNLVLKQNLIHLASNETFNYKDNIQSVSDNISQLTTEDVVIYYDAIKEHGISYVYYRVFDDANNMTEAVLSVIKMHEDTLQYQVSDLYKTTRDAPMFLEGVELLGNYYHIDRIIPDIELITTSYEIIYYVTDYHGNTSIIRQQVHIQNALSISQFIPSLMVVLTAVFLIGLIVFKRKKRIFT